MVRSTQPATAPSTAAPADPTSAPNPDLAAAKKAAGIADCPTTDATPAKGGLPDASVECLGGGRDVRLASLRGPLIVNVWASWCAPCRQEHPLLMALAKDPAIRLVGINYKDNPENARRFLGALGNPFAAVGADPNGRAAIDWGVYGVPETFVIGPDGTIRHKQIGPLTPEAMAGFKAMLRGAT